MEDMTRKRPSPSHLMEMDSPSTLDCANRGGPSPARRGRLRGRGARLAREVLANLDGEDEFDFVKDVARELP